jgi:hypothetical protein
LADRFYPTAIARTGTSDAVLALICIWHGDLLCFLRTYPKTGLIEEGSQKKDLIDGKRKTL